jgi:hypothetical protein
MRHFCVLLALFAACLAACDARPTPTPTRTPPAAATEAPLATAQTPTDTPTPFSFPAAVQREPTCPDAPVTRLILQERGRVLDDDPRALRMRSNPGTENPIVAQIPIGGVFLVLEGPVCGEAYAWYRVRYRGTEGWVAEGDSEQYYVEPYLPG